MPSARRSRGISCSARAGSQRQRLTQRRPRSRPHRPLSTRSRCSGVSSPVAPTAARSRDSPSDARNLRRDPSAALSRKVVTKYRRRAFAVQAGRLAERHDDGGWEGTGGIHDDDGRRLAFAIDASNVAAGTDPDAITRGVGQALGEIAAAAYGVAP